MITLNFKGPFHFDNIKNDPNLKIDLNKSGIYIWGFMYEFNNNGLVDPVDFSEIEKVEYDESKMKFIPYYVGKHESNISARLKQHQAILKENAPKYIRLSNIYMKAFFKDPTFPIHINTPKYKIDIRQYILQCPGKIEYFNDADCLKSINSKIILDGTKNHYPINNQLIPDSKNPLNLLHFHDTLDELININNNFWFCYFSLNSDNVKLSDLKRLETFTFWSLKGRTISKTGSSNSAKNMSYSINPLLNIFKNAPSDIFPGY